MRDLRGRGAPKFVTDPGFQKFTSSIGGSMARRKVNQSQPGIGDESAHARLCSHDARVARRLAKLLVQAQRVS
jgi:hypothetical protein